MKTIAEYIDKAIHFEQVAAAENDSKLKAVLLAQTEAFRKLAAYRAERLGLPYPPRPRQLN